MTLPRTVVIGSRAADVLRELCTDAPSNAEIGRRIYVTEDTIKTHLRRLYRATGTRNRTELVAAVMTGRIRPEVTGRIHWSRENAA